MDVQFKIKDGYCPRYKNYYIGSRNSGTDIHGNSTYEYALFRTNEYELVGKFCSWDEAIEHFASETGHYSVAGCKSLKDISISRCLCGDVFVIDDRYVRSFDRFHKRIVSLDSKALEVYTRMDDTQISGYSSYSECLEWSKKYITEHEPRQLSFLDIQN